MLRALSRRGHLFTPDVVAVPATAALPRGSAPSVMTGPSTSLATDLGEPDEKHLEPRQVERRQLTVMACEVIGLARLSTRLDPEELGEVTAACHRCCTDIIERYHDYVANYSIDGVLAYFGYPQAD